MRYNSERLIGLQRRRCYYRLLSGAILQCSSRIIIMNGARSWLMAYQIYLSHLIGIGIRR